MTQSCSDPHVKQADSTNYIKYKMKTVMLVLKTVIAQPTGTKRHYFILNYLKLYLNVTVMSYSTLLHYFIQC